MPYEITKKGNEFCVVKKDGGKTIGCHASKEKASAQLRALYAQESSLGGDLQSHKQRLATQLFVAEEVANFNPETLEAEITIVKPGISDNNLDHTPRAIARAVKDGIWNNSRMFVDHGEPGNMERMPWRRSLHDLVSKITRTWVGENGEAKGQVKFINKEFFNFAHEAKDVIGVSMATWYEGRPVRKNGKRILEIDHYTKNRSIDWVAFPAAGGAIDKFLPAQESMEVDWDELTTEMLTEHRPDIVEALKPKAATESAGNESGDGKKTEPPAKGSEVVAVSSEDVQRMIGAALEEAKGTWETDLEKKEAARKAVADFIKDAGLPEATQQRIIRSLGHLTEFAEESVQPVIDEAFKELEAAGFKKKAVTGNGPSGTTEPRETAATPQELEAAGYGDLVAMESRLTYEPTAKEEATV